MKTKELIGRFVDMDKAWDAGFEYHDGTGAEWATPLLLLRLGHPTLSEAELNRLAMDPEEGEKRAREYKLVLRLLDDEIAEVERWSDDGDDELYVRRFHPKLEKKADRAVKKILIPKSRVLIGHEHKADADIFGCIHQVMERAKQGKTTVRRSGAFIFFSAGNDAWMLAPLKGAALWLMLDGEKKSLPITYSTLEMKIEWDGFYEVCGYQTGKRISWEFRVRLFWNGKRMECSGYPCRKINEIEKSLFEQYPKLGKKKPRLNT